MPMLPRNLEIKNTGRHAIGVLDESVARSQRVYDRALDSVQQASAVNSLREPGIIQRVESMNSSLQELKSRLNVLHTRLHGGLPGEDANSKPISHGIYGHICEAEETIRDCIKLAEELNERF
jgi:hypothetical protein